MSKAPTWAREPRIKPNYSMRKYKRFPRNLSNQVKKVLLYSNVKEANMLEERRKHLTSQQTSSRRRCNLDKQAFIVRQIMQEMQLEAMGANNTSLLPKALVQQNRHLAMFHNFFYTGGKDLPMHQRLDRFSIKSLQNAQMNRDVVRTVYTVPVKEEQKHNIKAKQGNNVSKSTAPPMTLTRAATFHATQNIPNKSEILIHVPSTPQSEILNYKGYRAQGYKTTDTLDIQDEYLPSVVCDTNVLLPQEQLDPTEENNTDNLEAKLPTWPSPQTSGLHNRGHKILPEKTISTDSHLKKIKNLQVIEKSKPKAWRSTQSMVSFLAMPDIIYPEMSRNKNVHKIKSTEKLHLPLLTKHHNDHGDGLCKELSSLTVEVKQE